MIAGAHVTIFSKDAAADRKFFKDVLKLPSVDAGGGWLIFSTSRATCGIGQIDSSKKEEGPENEMVSPVDDRLVKAEFMLAVDDIEEFRKSLKEAGNIDTDEPSKTPWGIVTKFTLPGGAKLEAYQPLHPICSITAETTSTVSLKAGEEQTKKPEGDAVTESISNKRIKV
jgi:catechol 2,3-dioxygenase-like lactoylglutathione lyase family enzyme